MNPTELEDILCCVGPGWHPIIRDLVTRIEVMGWDGDVAQVKEKFGTLRFYIGAASEEVHAAVTAAEDATAKVCEDCGAPGVLRTRGWYRTLCDACTQVKP